MHHYGGVGQAEAVAFGAAAEEQGAHGGGLPDADCVDGAGDVGHCVVDCEACCAGCELLGGGRLERCFTGCDGAAGGVDVEVYGFFGVVCFEEEELGDYVCGDSFVDCAVEADDSFLLFC